jgi:thioesterase domain-containing protein/acyl carrier protein
LLNGAGLFPFDIKKEGLAGIADWLIQEEITIYHSTPTVFRHFIGSWTGLERFPRLRMVQLGGEPLVKRDAELYREYFSPECRLVHRLAATETGTIRLYTIGKDTGFHGNLIPVGYRVKDKEVLLLDDAGKEVEQGEAGEIAVKSRYLSPGYWGRPDLTTAKFLPDPQGGGERIYRTGDLGRMSEDGYLVHLGRKDFQIKIRGNRVDVAEVERTLHEHATVKEAVVVARKGETGEPRLVGYIVPSDGMRPTVSGLRRFLMDRLPAYMVPSTFSVMESFPRTDTGKVNRLELPDPPERARPELEVPFVAPETEAEKELAKIVSEILELDQVGIRDDFFDLGGDSISVMRLFAQIEMDFGKRFPPTMIFDASTVKDLAQKISEEGEPATWPTLVPIQPRGSRVPFFCVHPGGGAVLSFAPLAFYLGIDQPFYALQARGLDGKTPPLDRIEDIAAHYLQEIRAIQSEGPFLLGGMCLGGLIALEMAQQLLAQGPETALLAVFDTRGMPSVELEKEFLASFPEMQLIGNKKRKRSEKEREEKRKRNAMRKATRGERQEAKWKKRAAVLGLTFETLRDVLQHGQKARREYVPKVYPGRITLFSEGDEGTIRKYHLKWRKLAGGDLDRYETQGVHIDSLREPSIDKALRIDISSSASQGI